VEGLAVLLLALAAAVGLAGMLELRGLADGAGVAGGDDPPVSRGQDSPPVDASAAVRLGLPERIRRAGRSEDLTPRSLLVGKGLCAATGFCLGSIAAGALPGRIGVLVMAGSALAGFLLPDLLLERSARRRHRRMVLALPDALDLLAVSASAGRSLAAGFGEVGSSGRGPLAREMRATAADLAWGMSQGAALESFRARIGGSEVASLVSTLERSRRLGSPLADQLRRQASGLRQDQRRRIEEDAARAAPKIQLVIALVLVPSVLLLIVAALVANSDALLGLGYAA
jgi:tight adherence protein C